MALTQTNIEMSSHGLQVGDGDKHHECTSCVEKVLGVQGTPQVGEEQEAGGSHEMGSGAESEFERDGRHTSWSPNRW